ncbi:hypothetical protein HN51_060760 [Arachis hypogaea]|uniref:DC1 domain-containing protein n=1 Tax=Arachis hypogaea TaxID=3818 RepID=A0A444XAS2_ARAHY|nr:uncharacterized protein LOC107621674 [Arachis ipaensis]XP_025684201.1 uncharacterized protein LOC112785015 [Arachis hypogaea]QHO04592.1 uncharacterized protein DS421_13g441510 [Arachis hypogaea]RYQ86788.1 hypothetical protein Ahy_B10g106419 [Arachis hypogaea]
MMMNQNNQAMMRKTRTFQLQKAPSNIQEHQFMMTSPNVIDQYSNFTPKKASPPPPPPVKFPTSPEQIFGQEIIHFSHPQHSLSMVEMGEVFVCVGCKEYGCGKRFVCQECEFQLHDFCAFAPPALKAHPLHSQHSILFHSKPAKSGKVKSKCDVCGKPTKGFAFICTACGYQMHPCCAMLNTEIDYPPHPHTLKILPAAATASAADSTGFICGECKRKRSGRVYKCTSPQCEYYIHAWCAKSKVNGLKAHGIKPPEKPSMIATAAKVASQVVIEFIGGLVEGIGEGVGEVLVQNITKGSANDHSHTSNTSNTTSTRTRPH